MGLTIIHVTLFKHLDSTKDREAKEDENSVDLIFFSQQHCCVTLNKILK